MRDADFYVLACFVIVAVVAIVIAAAAEICVKLNVKEMIGWWAKGGSICDEDWEKNADVKGVWKD